MENVDTEIVYTLIKDISFTTIGIIFILLFIVYIRLIYTSRKKTERNIDIYKNNNKYIKELFTEIKDYKEIVRYFVFEKKWIKRIKKQFNNLFRIKPKFINFSTITSHIYSFYTFNKTISIIKKQHNIFKEAYENKKNIGINEYPDAKYKAENYSYWMKEDLEKLKVYCEIIDSKFLMITGNAGSGKSNLICNVAEMIMTNKYPCVFINLKDVDVNIDEIFYESLPLKNVLKFIQNKLFNIVSIISIIDFMCKIKGKKFFILLDALNENNDVKFLKSLCKFIDTLLEKKSFKIILTCRNEYFDNYYNKILEQNINTEKMKKLDISNNISFSNRDKFKLHYAYKKHFNFKGNISNFVYDKISQLLLIRILYETNKNSSNNILDLNKFEIFKNYINLISKGNQKFEALLKTITQKMIDSLNFNYILIKDLNLNDDNIELLKKICDENMIMTRKIVENEGKINEEIEESISFVFDELRDYFITKITINNINKLFELLNNLKEKMLSPLEGVITYSYLHFREEGKYDICKSIIEKYIEIRKLSYTEINQNLDFGMNIIFEHGKKLLDFEKVYIFGILNNNDSQELFNHFVVNLLRMCKLKIDTFHVFFEYLMTIKSISYVKSIFDFILPIDIVHPYSYKTEQLLNDIKEKVVADNCIKILSEIVYGRYKFNELDISDLNIILRESQSEEIKNKIKNICDEVKDKIKNIIEIK